jgi:hypothetical protein
MSKMMDVKRDLKEQYHAALAMLADCVKQCPDDVWTSGTHPRTFWRIALHAAFFTHLYLGQNEMVFQPWPAGPESYNTLWKVQGDVEPYELPEAIDPLQRQGTLDYIGFIDSLVNPTLDNLDLDASETGFGWYKNMSKLSHELMNLRHIQGHIGQLSELLMAHGIDTDWIGKAASCDRT